MKRATRDFHSPIHAPLATSSAPGSTATVSLLHKNVELYLGHVGDSRAILCRNGQARRLTSDHCPSLLAEKVDCT